MIIFLLFQSWFWLGEVLGGGGEGVHRVVDECRHEASPWQRDVPFGDVTDGGDVINAVSRLLPLAPIGPAPFPLPPR